MRIKKERINRAGNRELIVELDGSNTQILQVDPAGFYRLGNGVDGVVSGHALVGSVQVSWCDIAQEWKEPK